MDEKLQSLHLQLDTSIRLIDKEAELISNLVGLINHCKKRQEAFVQRRAQLLLQIELIENSIITSN